MEEPLPERGAILKAAIGIGLYAMAFGASFGAISVGSGLSVPQTMLLSLVMFTGASQFAFVGVAASGGSPFAAVSAALLLGVRNAFYGVPVSGRSAGWPSSRSRRVWTRCCRAGCLLGTALAVAAATGRAMGSVGRRGRSAGAGAGGTARDSGGRGGRCRVGRWSTAESGDC